MAYKDLAKKRENARKWRAENKERVAETQRKWYAENKEKAAETSRKWSDENKERKAESERKWRAENKERKAAFLMVGSARRRAEKKGLPFDLDGRQDDLQAIITAGTCHYTGLPFNLHGGRTWDSPSLDRVVPELGYVWSNVRVVLFGINNFKGTTTLEKICFVAEHLLDWQAAKTARCSVLLSNQQKETDSEDTLEG